MFAALAYFFRDAYHYRHSRRQETVSSYEAQIIRDLSNNEGDFRLANKSNDAELITNFRDLCSKAGIKHIPKLIIYESNTLRATLLPTASIALSSNLVESFTQKELNFVLAHEINHLSHRGKDRIAQFTALISPVIVGGLAAYLGIRKTVSKQSPLISTAKFIVFFGSGYEITKFGARKLLHSFQHKQELVADEGAIRLTGDLDSAKSSFAKAQAHFGKTNTPKSRASHPDDARRISFIEKIYEERNQSTPDLRCTSSSTIHLS